MRKRLYISIILNLIALLMIGRGVFALDVSKEIQDLVGYIQSMVFTDDGTVDGNVKVRISGIDGGIYASGGIWIGKGGGNGIYSNGTNVGIGTTDLSNRLNIGGDVGVKNESKLKMGLNGNSYVQGTGNIMNIISQGVVNMEGVRNYIRGGVVTFGSTWYDENDNNYFLDLNNNSKLSNLNTKGVVTINTAGNAELDIKSGSLGHWGIYHDTASEDLRFRNGGLNRLSIGKGGEIYTNNGILVDGSKNWKGNMFQSDIGGTGLTSCLSGETIVWDGTNNKWKCGSVDSRKEWTQCGDILYYDNQEYPTAQVGGICWIVKNLNIGTMIPQSQAFSNNGVIEKKCYNNIESNCEIYGGVYNRYESTQYNTSVLTKGICPTGWHVPSSGELKTAYTAVGGRPTLKSSSIWNWYSSYSFSSSWSLNDSYLWSSNNITSGCDCACAQSLNMDSSGVYWEGPAQCKPVSFPVRCAKD